MASIILPRPPRKKTPDDWLAGLFLLPTGLLFAASIARAFGLGVR